MERNKAQYMSYEYKNVIVNRKNESFWEDGYRAFGWNVEKEQPVTEECDFAMAGIAHVPLLLASGVRTLFRKVFGKHKAYKKVQLQLKREKYLDNKMQLNRIQVEFEARAKEIDMLEESRSTGASIISVSTGLMGTVFVTGSALAYLKGMVAVSAGLAVPGTAVMVSALLYYVLKKKRSKKVDRLIDEKQESVKTLLTKVYGASV